jgi:hypothetical protein
LSRRIAAAADDDGFYSIPPLSYFFILTEISSFSGQNLIVRRNKAINQLKCKGKNKLRGKGR